MPKRSPEDILRDIEQSDIDDATDRVLAMTPEERRKELEAAGFDVDALHAKADEWHDVLQRATDAAVTRDSGRDADNESPRAPSARRRVVLLVAAAAIAAATLAVLLSARLAFREEDVATPPPASSQTDTGPRDAPAGTLLTPAPSRP